MQSVKRLAVDTGIGAKRVYEIWTPYLNARWLLKTRHAKMQLHEMNVSSPLSFEAYTCPIWRHLAPHVQNANACKIHLFPHFTRPPLSFATHSFSFALIFLLCSICLFRPYLYSIQQASNVQFLEAKTPSRPKLVASPLCEKKASKSSSLFFSLL